MEKLLSLVVPAFNEEEAMEQSFGAEPGSVPPEFRALEDELRQEGVRG